MKKAFMAICSLLPGGLLLAGAMMLFIGCARFQYETDKKQWIRGVTISPETVMMANAESEAVRAGAYAARKCADEPGKCRAAELASGWGQQWFYTPAGYSWGGNAASAIHPTVKTEDGDLRKEVKELKRTVRAMDAAQDAFNQTLINKRNDRSRER